MQQGHQTEEEREQYLRLSNDVLRLLLGVPLLSLVRTRQRMPHEGQSIRMHRRRRLLLERSVSEVRGGTFAIVAFFLTDKGCGGHAETRSDDEFDRDSIRRRDLYGMFELLSLLYFQCQRRL